MGRRGWSSGTKAARWVRAGCGVLLMRVNSAFLSEEQFCQFGNRGEFTSATGGVTSATGGVTSATGGVLFEMVIFRGFAPPKQRL
jgi:hypothetical protein